MSLLKRMKRTHGWGRFHLLVIFLLIAICSACEKDNDHRFPLAEEYNMDESRLIGAFEEMRHVNGAISLIVSRSGNIVAEEYYNYNDYGKDSIKNIMSVTKSFTGVLIGLAIDKGFIGSVHDSISSYLDEVLTFPDPAIANISIDQLLKMSAGHTWNGTSTESLYSDWMNSEDQLQYIVDLPLAFDPGTMFNYSDGASHLLSVILTQATGQNTLDFAEENLFKPLGISEYEWVKDPEGYPYGAAHLRILPRDMVTFGTLILNKGMYEGKQIVPSGWIDEMTTSKISTANDVPYGSEYGYQIWIGYSNGAKHIMAMGWGGQFIFIVPDNELVVTATCWTSGVTSQQAGQNWASIIDIIVNRIFPAVD
jgi:CubicO group peptidase (beta-lactamase class C family)